MGIGWSELVSVLIGAAATGGLGIYDRRSERLHRRRSLTNVARAHAKFLTGFIRQQCYEDDAKKVVVASRSPDWDGSLLIVDAAGDYLSGIKECALAAGELDADVAAKVIEFSHRAQLFLDSTKADGPFLESATLDEKRSHAQEAATNIKELLQVGEALIEPQ